MESLSDEILVRIFRLLSARDLCRCSQVCSAWCRLTNDFHLWKRLFKKTFDKFITDPFYYNSVFPTQWKELFILRSNWFSGHCHVQSLHRRTVTTPHLNEVPVTKVSCLKISNCGRSLLASVNQDSRQVHLWSLIHKCSLHVVNCEGVVGCVDFGSERSRNLLAVGLHSNKFSLWDFQREKFLHSQSNLLGTSRGIVPQDASSPPELAVCRVNLVDNKLATVTVQCVVKIWQLEFHQHGSVSCHCLHTLTTFKPRCSVLDIQLKREPDDIWTVSISHAAEILEKWNLIGFQVVRFHGQTLINISQRVQVEDEVQEEDEEDVGIVYLESKAWTQRHTEQMGSRNTVSCLSISPCTKLITSGQDDNTISLWDTSTLCLRYTLFGHTGAITCTDVDMHKVVSGSNDRTVKVWSLESGDCQLTLPGDHSSGVSCVTFNDQWVISGDNSGEIKVWDFAVNSLSVLQSQDLIEAEDQGI